MEDEPGNSLDSTQVELQRLNQRYDLAKSAVPVLWIAALYVPLRAAIPIADVLAGKHTTLSITITITIAITIALGAGLIALLRRSSAQRRELRRLRLRCEKLERQLEAGGS